jgi:alpha-N-arabinofuranosidase
MGQYDKDHHVKLVVDEYGPWYREGTELDPTHLFGQQVTIRDALATALTLDTFNRNADKVSMATCAQLVNNLNALFLCHEDRFIVTPNYYVFEMYAVHQGAQCVRAEFSGPEVRYDRDGKTATFWGLKGSASRKGNIVTVSAVNPDLSTAKQTQIVLRGARVSSVQGRVLAADDMHAHNSFDQPERVKSVALESSISRGMLNVVLPAASISKLEITLA